MRPSILVLASCSALLVPLCFASSLRFDLLPLYTANQVPDYLREAFILTGYRANYSFSQCVASIFQLHNETMNIWTHAIASVCFWKLVLRYHRQRNGILAFFCLCKAAVFTASFAAHTFSPISEGCYLFLYRLDWSMISVAMFGSCATIAHFAYDGDKRSIRFWFGVFGISTGIMFAVVNSTTFTQFSPALKCLGPLIPVPCFMAFLLYGYKELPKTDSHKLCQDLAGPIALAIAGLAVYGLQVPERWYQGCCDVVGGSHAIHHLWTITFAIWMLRNSLQWSKWRSSAIPL